MRSFFGSAALGLALLVVGPALAQDHEEHGDHGGNGGDGVAAVGVVNTIDAPGREINISHEPIPDLGWPSMTMDLSLSDEASLEGIEEGTAVTFTLKKGADGMYQIDTIMPAGDHGMDHGDDVEHAITTEQPDVPMGVGVINEIDLARRKVNLTHEPIKALGWPAMTMALGVAESADLSALEAGAKVVFTLRLGDGGTYVIDSIEPDTGQAMHLMHAAAPSGAWAYTSRDNPSPAIAGRWEMVPVAGTRGAEWVVPEDMDMAARCAALQGNATAMVDAATRAACAGQGPATPVLKRASAKPDHHGAMEMEEGTGHHGGMEMEEGAGHHGDGAQEAAGHAPHWMAPEAEQDRPNPIPADHESIARGAALFKTNCVLCHGPSGRGDGAVAASLDPRPADLAIMAGMHPAGDFAWKIANGRGAMPAWKELLSEAEIWDLVNFVKRLPEMAVHEPAPADDDHDHEQDDHAH